MFEFESTLGGPRPSAELCVVYDVRDGRIVQFHGFIGDGTGVFGPNARDKRKRIALEDVRRRPDAAQLAVIHAPAAFTFELEAIYRVAVESRRLEVARRGRAAPS